MEAHADIARELRWFRAVLALCFLATLLLSWRLWLSSGRDYPLVPLIDGLPQPPFPLDWLLLGTVAAALGATSFVRRPRPYLVTVLVIFPFWLVLDQTRLQPYVLTFLAGTACLLLGESRALRAPGDPSARWHLAPYQLSLCAVYFYSGVHKLNVRFLEHGFPGWTRITQTLGIDASAVPALTFGIGLAAAAGEAALGVALLRPRTRRPAVVGLTLMHVYIMLFLGAHGLAGNTVVWPWNVAVVASLWLLFWPRGAGTRLDGFVRSWWRGRRAAPTVPGSLRWMWRTVVVVFALLPALSFAELWYASLSFPLYAAKYRQVRIYYRPDQRAALPPAALRAARSGGGEVDLLWWSMSEMNVVPVMETHVVTRIGRQVASRAPKAGVRLVVAGQPDVFSGERGYRTFVFRGSAQVPHEVPTEGEFPGMPRRKKD
jgi:hypothetical protein